VASTRGAALVVSTTWVDGQDPRTASQPGKARPVVISIKDLATGKAAKFQVVPDQTGVGKTVHGAERSPALPPLAPSKKQVKKPAPGSSGTTKSPELSADSTVDDARTCSIPRNDPHNRSCNPNRDSRMGRRSSDHGKPELTHFTAGELEK